jgi:hypothetical protein
MIEVTAIFHVQPRECSPNPSLADHKERILSNSLARYFISKLDQGLLPFGRASRALKIEVKARQQEGSRSNEGNCEEGVRVDGDLVSTSVNEPSSEPESAPGWVADMSTRNEGFPPGFSCNRGSQLHGSTIAMELGSVDALSSIFSRVIVISIHFLMAP